MGRPSGKRECGVCGNVRRIEIRARNGSPDICACCAPRRPGVCGVCGRVARIARKASEDSPAVGICCYRLPAAVCTDCGQQKPCYWAHDPEPVCPSCTRVRRAPVCIECGRRRPANRRVSGGVVCGPCDVKRGGTTGVCEGCGETAPLIKRLCARCRLRARVAELGAGADPGAAASLAPFLAALAAAENPESTLRWFYTPGFAITRRLLAGEVPVSHDGLDEAALTAARAVAFVRAKLVSSGVLEPRDEYSVLFAHWHAQAVLAIEAGPDRAHVRAYATWRVAHQLARSGQRRAGGSYPSLKYARSLVNEAIKLVLWLHAQQLELAELRQDLLDMWVEAGGVMRRRVRLFIQWLERAGVTGPLEVAWDDRLPRRDALDDQQRLAILRGLLHDRDLDLRDRFASSVLLLYGRPLTRITELRTTHIRVDADAQVTLTLGRGEISLPDPLDAVALALRSAQLERAGGEDCWLLAGRHAGMHITAEALGRRLRRYGIERSRQGRHAALLGLACRLPAPILAERIGIHQSRAAQWVRLAGATYADYVQLRTQPSGPVARA